MAKEGKAAKPFYYLCEHNTPGSNSPCGACNADQFEPAQTAADGTVTMKPRKGAVKSENWHKEYKPPAPPKGSITGPVDEASIAVQPGP